MSTTTSSDDVPFYLMPVAAVLGMLAAFCTLRLIYLIYTQVLFQKKPSTSSPYASIIVPRSVYIILVVTIVVSTLGYAKVVACVNNAMEASSHALFDPFEILHIPTNANATVIKQAYRNLSKIHHPDKGGSPTIFHNVHLAYQALTDNVSMKNYQQHGHPEGPPFSQTMAFALPTWLLHPEGNVVFILLGLYLGMFCLFIYAALRMLKSDSTTSTTTRPAATGQVTLQDSLYLASNLSPTTSHLDILYMISTTPDNIQISQENLRKIQQIKQERQKQQEKSKKSTSGDDFELDDDNGGWADDDDEDDENEKEATLKAKQLEEEQEKERLSLKKAQGTDTVLLEGMDDGVIGQAWVESTLIRHSKWPPTDLGFLEEKTFPGKGNNPVGAMEHTAVRRNLCMTYGRLHSTILNSDTLLLEAGSKGLIDRTYFGATAEFRKRTGALLESTLRMAIILRSYRLTKTILETICMFKIGTPSPCDASTIAWFDSVMKRQYGCVPRLDVKDFKVYTDDEDEIATNDTCTLEMEMDRTHAENFTKQKVALCQKQNIPPQVALQAYQEGWWVMIRASKLDGKKDSAAPIQYKAANEQMKKVLASVDVETFASEKEENRLLNAFPIMVQNCAQPKMKLKLQFKAPAVPGKYRFYIDIKSQEFLGADQVLTCEHTIVDEASVKKKSEEEEDSGDEAEAKKDK